MNPDRSPIKSSRRSLAIGVWSLLVLPMALASTGVSMTASIVTMLLVSIGNTAALLLVEENWPGHPTHHARSRYVAAAVSLVIPFVWAMLLGARSSSLMWAEFAVIGLTPACLALMTLHLPIAKAPKVVLPLEEKTGEVNRVEATWVEGSTEERAEQEGEKGAPIVRIPRMNHQESDDFSNESRTLPFNVTQWLTRSRTGDGEIIEGGVRIDFADGQRDATVHISFCPPFPGVPRVTAEDLDGADLEIRIAATFPFGTRLSVRRSTASESREMSAPKRSCRIRFVAVANPVRRAA